MIHISAVIVTKDICKVYGSGSIKVEALKKVNIVIDKGDYISLIGPSGSGKSTLMNVLGCLDTPTSGHLYIDDIDVSTLKENQLARIRREKIGFIFQKYNLIPTLTALENVALVMGFAGVENKKRIIRAKDLLGQVGLSHRIHHKPSEMSGGEQQRVAIARSLANNPSIILGDEPTGNVDTKSGIAILKILENINELGNTVIIVTHNLDLAKRAKRMISIQDGIVSE
ncbi:MAG: ABC transporter ATP-binding protein [Candidatus Thermoplasmatota archaeon]|nr:ABC transporter ATP-binding protein [Candidatus Thermoplasmatota archaeon]